MDVYLVYSDQMPDAANESPEDGCKRDGLVDVATLTMSGGLEMPNLQSRVQDR